MQAATSSVADRLRFRVRSMLFGFHDAAPCEGCKGPIVAYNFLAAKGGAKKRGNDDGDTTMRPTQELAGVALAAATPTAPCMMLYLALGESRTRACTLQERNSWMRMTQGRKVCGSWCSVPACP